MLRNFVQIVRSGVVGPQVAGHAAEAAGAAVARARAPTSSCFGLGRPEPVAGGRDQDGSPEAGDATREALYGYLIGRPHDAEQLAGAGAAIRGVQARRGAERAGRAVPDADGAAARPRRSGRRSRANAPWQMTRMNLNTFARHGVFERPRHDADHRGAAARSRQRSARRGCFRTSSWRRTAPRRRTCRRMVRDALQDAMEVAIGNVPAIEGKVYVCSRRVGLDVVAGHRLPQGGDHGGALHRRGGAGGGGVCARTRWRKCCRSSRTWSRVRLNPRDTVMTNAQKLAAIGGGGTNCSAPLAYLNDARRMGDLVVFVSDNESWVDARRGLDGDERVAAFKERNPEARLACIDFRRTARRRRPSAKTS